MELLYGFLHTEAINDHYEAHNLAVFAPDLAAEAMVCAVLCCVARRRRERLEREAWRPDVGSAWDYWHRGEVSHRVTVTGIDGEMVLLDGWREPAVHYVEFRDTFRRMLLFDEDGVSLIADLTGLGILPIAIIEGEDDGDGRILYFPDYGPPVISDATGGGVPVYAVPHDGRVDAPPAGPFFLDDGGRTLTIIHQDATETDSCE